MLLFGGTPPQLIVKDKTQYVSFWDAHAGGSSVREQVTFEEMMMPAAGVMFNLHVLALDKDPVSNELVPYTFAIGQSAIFTVRKKVYPGGGVADTLLSCTITAGGHQCSNLSHDEPFLPFDRYTLKVAASSPGGEDFYIYFGARFQCAAP